MAARFEPSLSSVIATSPDGVTGTDRAVANVVSASTTFGAGTFVVWGRGGAVAISTDAVGWTVVPVDSVHRISAMVFLGGRFLASGLYGEAWTAGDFPEFYGRAARRPRVPGLNSSD